MRRSAGCPVGRSVSLRPPWPRREATAAVTAAPRRRLLVVHSVGLRPHFALSVPSQSHLSLSLSLPRRLSPVFLAASHGARSLARSLSSSQPRSQPQPLSQQQLVHEERAEWPPSRPSSLAFSLDVYPPLRSNRPRMTAAAPHAFAAASNLTSRRRHRRYDRHSTVAVFFTCASS